MGAIPATEVIAEEGEDENADTQQSGSGTIHGRLYQLGKSIDRNRKNLVEKGEQEKMKECKFQPNLGRVVSAKHFKKKQKENGELDDDDPNRKKTGKEIAMRLYGQQLAAKLCKGRTGEDVELEKHGNEFTH